MPLIRKRKGRRSAAIKDGVNQGGIGIFSNRLRECHIGACGGTSKREFILLVRLWFEFAQNNLWEQEQQNRGESLLDCIINNNLSICNIGNLPTFVNKICHEVIDITLCPQDLSNNLDGEC